VYLLGIDLETTGLDPNKDEIIEVGAVVWDTSSNSPVELFSQLISVGSRLIPQKITELTTITDEQLKLFGAPVEGVIAALSAMGEKCEFYVGHNALRFDKKFLKNTCERHKIKMPDKPWIDTTIDVDFPADIRTRKLSYLAAEHKFVGIEAHRAAFDVMTMFKILAKYNIDEVCARAKSDLVVVVAKVDYENRDKASENGFRWDPSNKTWSKVMRQYDVTKSKFPFGVNISKSDLLDD